MSKGMRGIVHALKARIGHDLLVAGVAMLAGFEHRPREDDGFVRPRAREFEERQHLRNLEIVADAFPIVEGAVVLPHFGRHFGELSIVLDAVLLERQNETIDVARHLRGPLQGRVLRFASRPNNHKDGRPRMRHRRAENNPLFPTRVF